MYSMEAFEQAIRDNLTSALGEVAGLEELSTRELVNLDNFKLGLEEAFNNDVDAANDAFVKVVEAYGGGSQQALE
jgi:hypothetical protein